MYVMGSNGGFAGIFYTKGIAIKSQKYEKKSEIHGKWQITLSGCSLRCIEKEMY